MPAAARTVAIYSRVSTASHNTENQIRELRQVAERHGWRVVWEFSDDSICGAEDDRAQRPGLNAMIQAVTRREIELVMAWSVNRLGRSLQNLIEFLSELHRNQVDLYLHQQRIDTSTPQGKALFQMMGVFAEFERAMIRDRVNAGLARARAKGKTLGRPRRDEAKRTTAVVELRAQGTGINKIAKRLGIGVSSVQRIIRLNGNS